MKSLYDVIDKMAALEEEYEQAGDRWDELSEWLTEQVTK